MATEKSKEEKPKKEQSRGKQKGAPSAARQKEERVIPRLVELYRNTIVPSMMKQFKYRNVMQVPRLEKISINVGVGQATQDPKMIEATVKDLESIVGQKVVVTRAKKSISNFKLREGMSIGCRVTLRQARMYEFLDRFVNIAVPRIRDFRGLSDKSFDGRGNYTIGLKEHVVFPEVDVDKITRVFGMDITVVTTAKTDQEAYELLRGFGVPFVKRQEVLEVGKA
jgi:large subunit ribosomal protein L5